MNKYTLELESQGDKSSVTLRENGYFVELFIGINPDELIEKAKERAEQLKATVPYEEIVFLYHERKITYKTRGLEKFLILEIGSGWDTKLEVRSIVSHEGKVFSTFTDALNELKNFQLVEKTKTIIEL